MDGDIENLTAMSDYWHDRFVEADRACQVAIENMERLTRAIEACRGDIGEVAIKPNVVTLLPVVVKPKFVLLQGGVDDGGR
jgi:hypothetical protein